MLVVPSENLRVTKNGGGTKELQQTLAKVYNFLGLCPYDKLPQALVHETRDPDDLEGRSCIHFLIPYIHMYNIIIFGSSPTIFQTKLH